MTSEPYNIRSNDRVFAVGKTGAGKSAALRTLIWESLSNVVWFDMTGEEASKLNAPVLSELDHVEQALYPEESEEPIKKLVYAPETPTYEGFERLCKLVYCHGNIHLIADELMMVYRDNNAVRPTTDHHLKILTNGRKRGVGMSSATQRPVNVPLEAISESEHIFIFRLKLEADRRRMEKIAGKEVNDAHRLDQYRYYYDHDQMMDPDHCKPLEI